MFCVFLNYIHVVTPENIAVNISARDSLIFTPEDEKTRKYFSNRVKKSTDGCLINKMGVFTQKNNGKYLDFYSDI